MSPSPDLDIDKERLELDREKLRMEHSSRKNAFLWGIISAILSAAVTLGVAYISTTDSYKIEESPKFAIGPVEACRDSLRRLETLSNIADTKSSANLSAAIHRHTESCDDVLLSILEVLKK